MRTFTAAALLLAAWLLCASCRAGADSPDWTAADTEATSHWLRDLQINAVGQPGDGGIRVHSTPGATASDGRQYYRVSPYIGNLAVLGLLRAHRPEGRAIAGRWIDWFFGHLDPKSAPEGVPFEHFYLADGSGETVCVKPGDPHLCRYNDATDSAAATFFSVLAAYTEANGSGKALTAPGRPGQVERLADTLLALRNPDGLFWAKSDYHAKYLEDNCEVYAGLVALERLELTVYHARSRAARVHDTAEALRAAICTALYDSAHGHFYVAGFEDGVRKAADVTVWYPDMQSQFWPLLFGVVPASDPRARAALQALNTLWNGKTRPDWAGEPALVNGGWLSPDVACGALFSGESDRIRGYLASVKRLKMRGADRFGWPFTAADAGWLLTIATWKMGVNAGRR